MTDKIRYFLEAWEMNGVGNTIAKVQDSPGTVVTITVDDLKAALESRVLAERKPVGHVCGGTENMPYWHFVPAIDWTTIGNGTPLFTHPTPDDASQWISVKERLPAKETSVLCAVEFDGPGDWRIKVGGLLPYDDFNDWQIFGASWTPSHWMPLPKPPAAIDRARQSGEEGKS